MQLVSRAGGFYVGDEFIATPAVNCGSRVCLQCFFFFFFFFYFDFSLMISSDAFLITIIIVRIMAVNFTKYA